MAASRCSQCGKPLPRPAAQPMALKVYTPTPHGFEGLLREVVGLPADVPEGDHGGQVSISQGDPMR
jgi:hypothetical protein